MYPRFFLPTTAFQQADPTSGLLKSVPAILSKNNRSPTSSRGPHLSSKLIFFTGSFTYLQSYCHHLIGSLGRASLGPVCSMHSALFTA